MFDAHRLQQQKINYMWPKIIKKQRKIKLTHMIYYT